MSQEQTFIDALRTLESDGDPEPLVELFADDAELGNVQADRAFHGRDGAREFWTQDRALFGEIASEFRATVAGDGRAALEWTRTGTTRTGDDVSYEGVSLLEFDGDAIARFRAFYDPRALGRQVV